MHAHSAQNATWFVLEGEVTFHGEDEEEVVHLRRNEGLFIPRGTPYWFWSDGPEPLVILRVTAIAQDVPSNRIEYDPVEAASTP
jgi:mannose-6-phosphate isomerase-like protein (cupin superfamily)